MSTAITTFIEPVKHLVGDTDLDIQMREDAQYSAAIRTVVNLGKVVGDATLTAGNNVVPSRYVMDSGGTNITPSLTPATDLLAFCQLVYHAAKLFIVDITPTHWHTRAFSETVGRNDERAFNIMQEIWNTDNGAGCAGD